MLVTIQNSKLQYLYKYCTWHFQGEITQEPIIPFALFAHETRSAFDHQRCFNLIAANVDNAGHSVAEITDREFINVSMFPESQKIACWNHLKDNVKRKALALGASSLNEQQQVRDDFHRLLESATQPSYEARKGRYFSGSEPVHPVWTTAEFQQYYQRNIDDVVRTNSGRWQIREVGLEDAHGLTSNASETLNSQYKSNRPDIVSPSMTEVILGCHKFIKDEERNVQLAYYNQGPYRLKAEYKHLERATEDMPPFDIQKPDEVIREMKEILGDFEEVEMPKEKDPLIAKPTVKAAAQWLYENDRYENATKSGLWIVGNYGRELQENPNTVIITEPASCSCGSLSMCPHLLCALRAANVRPQFEMKEKEIKIINKRKIAKPTRGKKRPGT